jgi:nucleoside-diphosphate-sugar epimerase
MERATIVGVYDFIGYSLCRNLLDMGIEVAGIHPIGEKEDDYTEEKRLEIGRNANFSEISLLEWQTDEAVDYLFVTLFEVFLQQDRTADYLETILPKLESRQYNNQRTVLLLPAFLAHENMKLNMTDFGLDLFVKSVKSSVLIIYLPTIFGPWQPEKCFFQKAMNHSSNKRGEIPEIDPWEWTEDCLYIDDAVNLIRKMDESGEQGQFILSSGQPDRWEECARELLGQYPAVTESRFAKSKVKGAIKVKKVKKNEEVSKGLGKQREQYYRIYDSRV